MNENYGMNDQSALEPGMRLHQRAIKRITNAYMLVYIRDADRDRVIAPVTNADIPQYLLDRFEKERQEELVRRKERELAQHTMAVRITDVPQLQQTCLLDLVAEADDFAYRLNKDMPIQEFLVIECLFFRDTIGKLGCYLETDVSIPCLDHGQASK